MQNAAVEKRIATVSIIVEDKGAVEKVNAALSGFGDAIVGRMGLPLKDEGLKVISIVLRAGVAEINSLTGKLGMIEGVSAKALMARVK